MTELDKQIHRDEFRLRVLVTNACARSCPGCLNDFQPKYPFRLLHVMAGKYIIHDYKAFADANGIKPIITFSGGEPAGYGGLFELVVEAGECTVVSRENALANHPDWESLKNTISTLHISVPCTGVTTAVEDMLDGFEGRVVFQTVMTEDTPFSSLVNLAEYAYSVRRQLKVFQDFNAPDSFDEKYQRVMSLLQSKMGDVVCGRFTGRQVNRGPGCAGCKRRCITLKGLWVFPSGMVSPCPQNPALWGMPDSRFNYLRRAYEFHRVEAGDDDIKTASE